MIWGQRFGMTVRIIICTAGTWRRHMACCQLAPGQSFQVVYEEAAGRVRAMLLKHFIHFLAALLSCCDNRPTCCCWCRAAAARCSSRARCGTTRTAQRRCGSRLRAPLPTWGAPTWTCAWCTGPMRGCRGLRSRTPKSRCSRLGEHNEASGRKHLRTLGACVL